MGDAIIVNELKAVKRYGVKNNSDLNYRRGQFYVNLSLIQENPEDCFIFMKDILILEARSNIATDTIEYYGISSLFDPLKIGEKVPEYRIEYTKTDSFTKVKAVRL